MVPLEARAELRDHFEVDHRYIVLATLRELVRAGRCDRASLVDAIKTFDINPDKLDPLAAPKAGTLHEQ